MQQLITGAPQYVWDDGVTFNFDISGFNKGSLGFFHRPINVSAFATVYGSVTPPVKWTEYDNLESWVEILKYSYRQRAPIYIVYDDTIYVNYKTWSGVEKPPGGGEEKFGGGWIMYWVYSVTLGTVF